ncbi:AAA family ATPase, partial [Patescibacteria group bacterium]|nr:AAA family ATPase [Patescibacteria group bacterium]MBU1871143.1 AAA family ATPase [Patescibacteria group bacterium]
MIKRLVIKNCLGIEELTINPSKVTVISGGNEKGKTSILETIEKALYNTTRRDKFVRTGAEKAYIELDTDDGIHISRIVAEDEAGLDKGTVKVTQDGIPVKSPETFLKELFGISGKKSDIFAFNPVDFMLKKDTEQTNILLGLLPIKVTPEDVQAWFGEAPRINYEKHGLQAIKDLEQWFYEARREANSRVKAVEDEYEAVVKRLPDNYKINEWEGINLGEEYNQLREAELSNRKITVNQEIISNYGNEIEKINNFYLLQEKEVLEEESTELEKTKKNIDNDKTALREQIASIDEHIKRLETEKAGLWNELKNLDAMKLTEKKEALSKVSAEKLKTITNSKQLRLLEIDNAKIQAEKYIEEHPQIDTEILNARCVEVEQMKGYIPLAKEVDGLKTRLKEEIAKANHWDTCVQIARAKPQELLSQVELPVAGLGINNLGNVTINGLPLSNLSTSHQIRV